VEVCLFDQILAVAVVLLPTLFAVVLELVNKEIKESGYWRVGVMAFGLSLSALTAHQMVRATETANPDRNSAIVETSQHVSAAVSESVTKAVTEQYAGMIADQKNQIKELHGQLTAQGKDVSAIKSSDFVTGKKPIKVEVTDAQVSRNQVGSIVMTTSPVKSIHPDATYCRKLIFTSQFPANPLGLDVYFSAPIKYVDSMVAFVYKGFLQVSQNDSKRAEIAMIGFGEDVLKPARPIVVNVCSGNVFAPVKLERRNVIEN